MKTLKQLAILLALTTAAQIVPAQVYNWTTIAGLYNGPGSQDGTNSMALFRYPAGMAVDAVGNIFIGDSGNYTIRKVTPSGPDWVVSTIAGQPGASGTTDGTNSGARFYALSCLVLDSAGNLYIPDSSYGKIRQVSPDGTNWVVSSITGLGASGVAVDGGGNLYTAHNNTIRKLTPSGTNWTVTTLAGFAGVSGLADGTNNVARFSTPWVFALDATGSVYVADNNGGAIRKATPMGPDWVVTTLPPQPGSSSLCMDNLGSFYFPYNNAIRRLTQVGTNWITATIGGQSASGGTDGTNSAAKFYNPSGVTVDHSGVVFVADTYNHTIRKGTVVPTGSLQVMLSPQDVVNAGASWQVDDGPWQTNASMLTNLLVGGHTVSFSSVLGWASPSNLVVTISPNDTTTVTGVYIQQFGSLQVNIGPPGAVTAGARWQVDSGDWQESGAIVTNLTVGSHGISFLPVIGWNTPTARTVTVSPNVTNSASANYQALGSLQVHITPRSASDAGGRWQVDDGPWQSGGATVSNLSVDTHTISFAQTPGWITPWSFSVNIESGARAVGEGTYRALYDWTTIAGLYNGPGFADGTNSSALFKNPGGLVTDGAGNMFVADTGNYVIRKLTRVSTGWQVTTIAGNPGNANRVDGTNAAARFYSPGRMVLDPNGNLYVRDYSPSYGYYYLRKIIQSGTNWVVTTIGQAPGGLAVDANGSLYTVSNYTVVKLASVGTNWSVTTLAGFPGISGSEDGTNNVARFYNASVIGVDGVGTVYVADNGGLRKLVKTGPDWVVTTTAIQLGTQPAIDAAGDIYYTSSSYHTISKQIADGTNWWLNAIGGSSGTSGSSDGTNTAARFWGPSAIAVDSNGRVYVADSSACTIRQGVTVPATGALQVSITPSQAADEGGLWRLDGGLWQTNAAVLTNLLAGTHVVSFSSVYGWSMPANKVVTISRDQTTLFSAPYVQQFGTLQVTITPTAAALAGAKWQVDDGDWQTSGNVVSNLSLGTHTLAFSPVSGWITPSNQTVTVGPNQDTTANGSYVALGSLMVTINPPGAMAAGAQWQLDGGTWQDGGTVVSNVALGAHTVAFSAAPGWITPNNQTVNVISGQTATTSGTYVALGAMQVIIAPPEAVSAGAQWQLDGGVWLESGTTVSNVALGSHTVAFSPLSSWTPASNRVVIVVSGQTTNVTGSYIPLGSLQVMLSPAGAVTAGARWQVDGGAWFTNGAIASNLIAGSHVVTFNSIAGWTAPAIQPVTVNLSETTLVTGVYVQQFGSVQAILSPAGAVSAGAQWQIDGGPWQLSGAILANVPVGTHTASFSQVAGWTTPVNQTISVLSNQTARVTAIYSAEGALQVTISPATALSVGAQWQVDGGPWLDSGAVATGLSRGTHVLSFKPLNGWLTPANQTLAIFAGQTVTATGVYTIINYTFSTIAGRAGSEGAVNGTNADARFNSPAGAAIDASGNIYLADMGNSVIRKLVPLGANWLVSTIAGVPGSTGSADGANTEARFNYPCGVAVDSAGTIFVADQVNSTIRRIAAAGTNWIVSTIAGSPGYYGSSDGIGATARFYYPAGLAVDPAGTLYVADQVNSTVRKITLVGTNWLVSTIAGLAGSYGTANGTNTVARFYWPSDIAVDAATNLYVADTLNNLVRKIALVGTNWVTSTLAGQPGYSGDADGMNAAAQFNGPTAISVDASRNVFVADTYNSTIRKLVQVGTNWWVNTIGGLAGNPGAADGTNSTARFMNPQGIVADAIGNIFVADTENATVRKGVPYIDAPVAPFSLTALPRNGTVALTWNTVVNRNYQVQYKTNLAQPQWVDLGPHLTATNSATSAYDTCSDPQRYYRVVVIP